MTDNIPSRSADGTGDGEGPRYASGGMSVRYGDGTELYGNGEGNGSGSGAGEYGDWDEEGDGTGESREVLVGANVLPPPPTPWFEHDGKEAP